MEPQTNFTGITEQPVYGRKKSAKSGCGKYIIIITIVLLLGIAGTAYLIIKLTSKAKEMVNIPGFDFGVPKENPENIDKRFTGEFIDAEMVTGSDGSQKLWILSDASVKFMLKQKSTGHFSMGMACNDCKTIAYIYDPVSGNVEKQTVNTFNDIIRQSHITTSGGKIYQFTNPTEKDGARINIYDASTGEIISDTKGFIDAHTELSSGIIDLTFYERDGTVHFNTKDGQKGLIYDPKQDKIFEDDVKRIDALGENAPEGTGSFYILRQQKNDERKSLLKATASNKDIITKNSTLVSYSTDTRFLKIVMPDANIEKIGDKTYLSGEMFYQDNDYVVFIYLDQAGKTANRIMTCIDAKTGKELWTMGPDELFSWMKIDNANGSSLSTTDSKIRVKRTGNILTLAFQGQGIMGIDPGSGKKLWTVEIHAK